MKTFLPFALLFLSFFTSFVFGQTERSGVKEFSYVSSPCGNRITKAVEKDPLPNVLLESAKEDGDAPATNEIDLSEASNTLNIGGGNESSAQDAPSGPPRAAGIIRDTPNEKTTSDLSSLRFFENPASDKLLNATPIGSGTSITLPGVSSYRVFSHWNSLVSRAATTCGDLRSEFRIQDFGFDLLEIAGSEKLSDFIDKSVVQATYPSPFEKKEISVNGRKGWSFSIREKDRFLFLAAFADGSRILWFTQTLEGLWPEEKFTDDVHERFLSEANRAVASLKIESTDTSMIPATLVEQNLGKRLYDINPVKDEFDPSSGIFASSDGGFEAKFPEKPTRSFFPFLNGDDLGHSLIFTSLKDGRLITVGSTEYLTKVQEMPDFAYFANLTKNRIHAQANDKSRLRESVCNQEEKPCREYRVTSNKEYMRARIILSGNRIYRLFASIKMSGGEQQTEDEERKINEVNRFFASFAAQAGSSPYFNFVDQRTDIETGKKTYKFLGGGFSFSTPKGFKLLGLEPVEQIRNQVRVGFVKSSGSVETANYLVSKTRVETILLGNIKKKIVLALWSRTKLENPYFPPRAAREAKKRVEVNQGRRVSSEGTIGTGMNSVEWVITTGSGGDKRLTAIVVRGFFLYTLQCTYSDDEAGKRLMEMLESVSFSS
ncbi:MAG: hypothetical protein R2684_07115 [Pyrinomonadaceae bacterium]